VAEALGKGAPRRTPHPRVVLVVAVGVLRRQIEQLRLGVFTAETSGQLQLESRVRLNCLSAVDRRHKALAPRVIHHAMLLSCGNP
jgi:hypothetical protein